MLKFSIAVIFSSIFLAIIGAYNVDAINSQNIVISQIQLGDSASAKNEFIEIYNNSSVDVDISNWCLSYLSSSLVPRQLACFDVDDISVRIILPGYSSALAVSSDMAFLTIPIKGDIEFSATMSGIAGYVKILDSINSEVDTVGWGDSSVEMDIINPPSIGSVIGRKLVTGKIMQDTGINTDDFEIIAPKLVYEFGFVVEEYDVCKNVNGFQPLIPEGYLLSTDGLCNPVIIDVCSNLEGIQIVVPDGHSFDGEGGCKIDVCLNLDGLQNILPSNMYQNDIGDCVDYVDVCINLDNLQIILPDGYMLDDDLCVPDLASLMITELLPNVTGSDVGNEFIEIFNPNDIAIDLGDYVIYIGNAEQNSYRFPAGAFIEAGEYLAYDNNQIKFTLLNSTSAVQIKSVDGVLIDETDVYGSPKDNMAWALLDGVWQYTNQPTKGSKNLPNKVIIQDEEDVEVVTMASLVPCAVNQYRSPETNRCRLIPVSESVLTPCKDGQYRSEETNRCRNIVSDVVDLMPCAEGQERNPETNRCRSVTVGSVLGTSDLKPCAEGQERNPETNRCRNVAGAMPQADYAPEQIDEPSTNYVLWWSFAGVGLIAISYGIWEWRYEIVRLAQKVGLLVHKAK